MKQIILDRLYLENFRSFIEPTAIAFSPEPGLKLVSGENQIEPRLGGNGVGKSSLFDALAFALYGSSVKGLRASDLISHGRQTLDVAVHMMVDGRSVLIRRTAPPMRIQIDAEPAEQAEVDRLIGLSRERFCHSVIFGQAVPLFLDLPVPARGDLLDEVLHLGIWMDAAEAASTQAKEHAAKLNDERAQIATLQGRLEGLGDPVQWRASVDAWEEERRARLERVLGSLEDADERLDTAQAALGAEVPLPDQETAKTAYTQARQEHQMTVEEQIRIQSDLKHLDDEVKFLAEHDVCPTCNQPLTKEHKRVHQLKLAPAFERLRLADGLIRKAVADAAERMITRDREWHDAVSVNQAHWIAHHQQESEVKRLSEALSSLAEDAERIGNEVNPHEEHYQRVLAEHAKLSRQLADLRIAEQQAVSRLATLDFWKQGFRRVRLFCLERVLAELTIETRNALMALGLAGWSATFKTATETKAGTLRLGVQVEIQAPNAVSKFDQLSGGEGQRARLAVSLGLATLIQRWAGVRFNFEVYDEPTAYLSSEGIVDLLNNLTERADANNRSIYICDHRSLEHGGFSEIIRLVKDENGSRIIQ
jgi:DNA repair exonuclease SbcCD ATPase subunit